jgi:hypothetical protein
VIFQTPVPDSEYLESSASIRKMTRTRLLAKVMRAVIQSILEGFVDSVPDQRKHRRRRAVVRHMDPESETGDSIREPSTPVRRYDTPAVVAGVLMQRRALRDTVKAEDMRPATPISYGRGSKHGKHVALSKSEMQDMLRQAVVNTGGVVERPPVPYPVSADQIMVAHIATVDGDNA